MESAKSSRYGQWQLFYLPVPFDPLQLSHAGLIEKIDL